MFNKVGTTAKKIDLLEFTKRKSLANNLPPPSPSMCSVQDLTRQAVVTKERWFLTQPIPMPRKALKGKNSTLN